MALGPQKVQIRRTSTPDNPPVGLEPGELSVEMANPLRLWVGVPPAIEASGKKLLVPQSGVLTSDDPPPAPITNQLWWESDTGIMWLWYDDGTSQQWVQVSSGGVDVPDIPVEADDVTFVAGGNLAANDVQEALIELDNEKVAKAGDTMTGALTLFGAPIVDLHATTKLYVDTADTTLQTNINAKIGDAPSDGLTYARKDAAWISFAGGTAAGTSFTPAGNIAATNVQAGMVELDNEKLADAPSNGNTYGRKDGAWIVVVAAGGGPVANAVDIAFTPTGDIAATNVQAGMAELDTEKLAKAGGTMTGALTLSGAPTVDLHAATKVYVDTAAALKVNKTGDTMTGDLTISKVAPSLSLVMSTVAGGAPIKGFVGATARWVMYLGQGGVESGSNTGSDFLIQSYNDAGAFLRNDLIINRQTGHMNFAGQIYLGAAAPTDVSHATRKDYVDSQTVGKVNKVGDTMTGLLTISGNAGATITGNVTTYGWGGNNNVGVVFLNSAQNRYLIFDGTQYNLPGAEVYAGNGRLFGSNDGTPVVLTGNQTMSGGLTVNGVLQGASYVSTPTVVYASGAGSPNWVMQKGGDGVLRLGTSGGGGILGQSMFEWHVDSIWWLTTIAAETKKPGGGPWNDTSDVRIKTVTGNYQHGLAEILTLNPVYYQFKGNDTHKALDDPSESLPYKASMHHPVATSGRKFIGLVAQEVETALPELVTKRPGYIDGVAVDDMRDLDTGPLIFALINAVKTLAARVEALEARNR